MESEEKIICSGIKQWHKFLKGYLLIPEVAKLLGIGENTVRRRCREKNPWCAIKQSGMWWIPLSGLYPVLGEPEHAKALAEFGRLRHEYSLHAIGYACILLTLIDDYNRRTRQYTREGKNEAESKVLALETYETSLYQAERLCSEYSQHGLRGLIEYTRACHYVFGCPEFGSAADRAYMVGATSQSVEHLVDSLRNTLSIRWYMNLVSGYNNTMLDNVRKSLEDSIEGLQITKKNPNRRLYAVLKPTREENLERIEYVLTGIGPFGLFDMLASVKLSMELYEQDNRDTG